MSEEPKMTAVPALPEGGLVLPAEPAIHMPSLPVSLQIFFNDDLFRRCQTVSNYLAKAEGYAPKHLIGKPEACFAVVSRALTWRLDPYAVAQATYQTPNGQVGYYGSLCQAIIENSGRLDPSYGGVKFEHVGDWKKLRAGANGRLFKMAAGQRGGEYPIPAWEQWGPLEEGLGVIVRAKMKEEDNPREMPFDLLQAYPRNSTLWATDPRTQICYTSVRRFATSTVPALFMGVPFDREDMGDWIASLHDVTPERPALADFTESGAPKARSRAPRKPGWRTEPVAGEQPITEAAATGNATTAAEVEKKWFFSDEVGEVFEFEDVNDAVATYAQRLEGAKGNRQLLDARWDNGARLLADLREHGHSDMADALNTEYGALLGEIDAADAAAEEEAKAAGATTAADASLYDVLVPLTDGMAMAQWFKPARDRVAAMTEAQRPLADFIRFREVNNAALKRLQDELSSWARLLNDAIAKGSAGAPT